MIWARTLRPWVLAAVSLTAVTAVVASLPWLRGDDPARTVLRARYAERQADPETLESIRREFELPDGPVPAAAQWLAGALRGDFGVSWVDGSPVTPAVVRALGVSATLSGAACAVAVLTALIITAPPLVRATRSRRGTGRAPVLVAALLASIPEFLLATMLMLVVAVHLRWLPTSGWSTAEHVVLPALALGATTGGLLGRVAVQSMDGVLAEDWVRTWRAAGVPPGRLVIAVMRRTVATVFPLLVLMFVGLLGSAVVVETVFDIRGLGATARDAVLAQDLPLVQASVAVLVLLGLAVGGLGIAAHRLLVGPGLAGTGLALSVSLTARRLGRTPVVLGLFLLAVIGAGLLRDPGTVELAARLQPPSMDHPLGTDALGRDVWARLGHGAALTLGTAAVISAVCLAVGLLLGLWGSRARTGSADVLNALPPVLVGIVVAGIAGPGLLSAALAVCLVGWVPLAVHARTLAAEVRTTGFMQAARVGGLGALRSLGGHLLPMVLPPVLRHAVIRLPNLALALAALSFIGLGAGHDSPEWGAMLAESAAYAERAPWTVAAPAGGLAVLGVGAALIYSAAEESHARRLQGLGRLIRRRRARRG